MRVSIITPTFNASRFIDACVENVVQQGEIVLEHIIADGGSTDGTVERIVALQATHRHIRLLPGPDRGQSDAMNKATALASGAVIGILNVDDFYEPGVVSKAAEILRRIAKPALVCGDCRIIDQADETIMINRPADLRPRALLQDSWLFPIPANPAAYFYTREVHDIVGGYDVDDSHAMDCGFLLSCAERVKMIYVPEHWGNFRYIPGAKTFEDRSGAARVTELIEQHKRHLSGSQIRKMRRLRQWRELRFKAGSALRRLKLRR
jgi:glycosyltransferase involved in cell wall biosynthesis